MLFLAIRQNLSSPEHFKCTVLTFHEAFAFSFWRGHEGTEQNHYSLCTGELDFSAPSRKGSSELGSTVRLKTLLWVTKKCWTAGDPRPLHCGILPIIQGIFFLPMVQSYIFMQLALGGWTRMRNGRV